ncbi:MAG: hypothetical protein EHM19_10900 [Candidatus Latescibacterota bacterium]|nr:MAG: hypothetical protein EHM19_10900 [Candidatus Latescibacterota bacterium]
MSRSAHRLARPRAARRPRSSALASVAAALALLAACPRAEPPPARFTLEGGSLAGWETPSGRLEAAGGTARLAVEDALSAFLSPGGLAIDALSINRMEIDIRIDPPEAGAFLYWTDDAERGFVPEWRAPIRDGRQVIDLSGAIGWAGSIDRLLLAPGKGARSAALRLLEARAPRGARERSAELWARFSETELRSQYSVNGIIGAKVGPLPFALLLGLLFVLLPLAASLRSRGRFEAASRRLLPRALLAGSLLFLGRAACDQARVLEVDRRFFTGRPLSEKIAATNPPGFYTLLEEAKRRVPIGAPVELRAAKPYPWERGGYYLYPSRVRSGAEYVVSYQTAAPDDSASCELLLRLPGTGTLFRRGAP